MVRISKRNKSGQLGNTLGSLPTCLRLLIFSIAVTVAFYSFAPFQQKMRKHESIRGKARFTAEAISVSSIISSGKPYLIYGTAWKKDETARLVKDAVHAGFRFIDTACQPKHYNEAGVGDGWALAAMELDLQRSDFFLQTKFTPFSGQDPNRVPYDIHASLEEQVKQSLKKSLENLRTDYLDSLVLHSPMNSLQETLRVWRVFESFVDQGKVRHLGISNCYDMETFSGIIEHSRVQPSFLQNRFYSDSNFDIDLRELCKQKKITYQSFWTLTANRHALATSQIRDLADRKSLTPQTLMYAFMMTMGHTPLSGTTNSHHMQQDVAIMERIQGGENILSDEEMTFMSEILGISESFDDI